MVHGQGKTSNLMHRAIVAIATAAVAATVVLATAGLATAGALAPHARAAQRAYHGLDGRIAFVRKGNIFSIVPTFPASGLRQLTRAGHASGPRWSPSGKRLAFLYRGNLWIMKANGSGKTQITRAAPRFTDARPSWSPNGRYLAFVKTQRHHAVGILTRYDTMTGRFATFTDKANGKVSAITALPAPVAWQRALNATNVVFASFIVFEGAAARCVAPLKFCLNAVGYGAQSRYKNGSGSLEFGTTSETRLTDPDWLPLKPKFNLDVLTSQQDCSVAPCAHSGFELTIGGAVQLPGAYEAVFNPAATSVGADGAIIAFVQDTAAGQPDIYTAGIPFIVNDWRPTLVTSGTEPDWQPVHPPVARPARDQS